MKRILTWTKGLFGRWLGQDRSPNHHYRITVGQLNSMTTTELKVAYVLAAQDLEASGVVTMTIRRIPAHLSPPTTEQGRTEPAQSEYSRWEASLPESYTDHAQWQLSAPELSRSGVMPYLAVDGAAAAITFYKNAFGATELIRIPAPGGKVGHAEIEIYGSRIMLADEYPDKGFRSPQAYGGTPMTLYLYVADVDTVARQAFAAGAKELRPVQRLISTGDRTGTFEDPFGHVWCIATRREVLSVDELKWRANQNVMQYGVAGVSMNVRSR